MCMHANIYMHAPHVSERELDQLKAAAAGQAPKAAKATRQAPAAKAGGGGLFGGLFGGGGGGGGGGAEVSALAHACLQAYKSTDCEVCTHSLAIHAPPPHSTRW